MTYHERPARKVFAAVAGWLTLAIGFGADAAAAQEQDPRGGYTGFFAAGVSEFATGELDDRLAAGGYPTFGNRGLGISLGAYRLLRSGVMLGGEWHFLGLGEKDHGGREIGLAGGYATLGVGYAVELSPRVRVYPRLGLGIGGMGLWTADDDADEGGEVGFDEALADSSAGSSFSTLSQGSGVVDVGAGAELLLGSRGGPVVGLRLGYVATPFDQGWSRNGRSLRGAPSASVAGPYVRVLVGWRRLR